MSGERLYPLVNPGPLERLPGHPPSPNGEDLVDLEIDDLRLQLAAHEMARAIYLAEIERLESCACGSAFDHGRHAEELLRRLREAA